MACQLQIKEIYQRKTCQCFLVTDKQKFKLKHIKEDLLVF